MLNKILLKISRLIIGLLFIFSGFVKAVDPIGSTIKFKDYLTAFHLDSFAFIVLPLAFIVSSLEFLTGVHILLNIRTKFFSWVALAFMCFFTPLTLILAITNPVTDCGCFGDALKLTNWETFFKNAILFIPTIFLFLNRKKSASTYSIAKKLLITLVFTIGILYINYYSLNHLPVIDFRPYKTGNNIIDEMTIPEGAAQPEYNTTFILKKGDITKEFTTNDYPYNDSTWVFVDSKSELINEGYVPPIHDFVLMNDEGEDITQNILNNPKATLLIISSQIAEGNWGSHLDSIKKLNTTLLQSGINTYCLTASTNEDITNFEFSNDAGFNYLTADETMLKTIIRSNPGLVLIQNGNILGKWHYNDLPDSEKFKKPDTYALKYLNKRGECLLLISLILIFTLLTSVILIRK